MAGCFENRMRLAKLIIENIRRKAGGNLPILCRINASDEVPGGQTVQDAATVAAYLEQECGVDALHVTRAVHLADEFMWAPGVTHGGFNADLVTEIEKAVSIPIIAVGRFTEPQYAELLVKQGRADLIAFGRQGIADPELPAKAHTGRLETLSPCIGCLLGCVPNMFAGKPITCTVNPCVGRELELTPAKTAKNVVVVGGGPGGLYGAWACAARGHHVTLLEKGNELGGNFRIAAYPTGKAQMGKRVLVVGGGMVGCEAAEFLAERGHQVGVIEMKDVIAGDVVPENRKFMFDNFTCHGVDLRSGAKVSQFYPDGVDYTLMDGSTGSMRGYDNIVLAMGNRSSDHLSEALKDAVPQVFVIGEAAKAPGNAVLATGDALDAALAI